jgi:hypothetical protein
MKDTLEKIKTLLSIDNKESKEVKMYAEMILDDGRVVATEDEQFMIGSEVFVVNDDGEASSLSAGTYKMEDGAEMTIDDNGKVLDLGEEKEAEDVEASEEVEEMAEESEAEDTDWAKTFEEMKDRVAALEKEVFGDKAEEETEDLSKEEVVEEKVEMSKDMVTSLVEEIEHLKTKLSEMENTPGAEGFNHNPEMKTKSDKVDLAKMSINDRVKYLINN